MSETTPTLDAGALDERALTHAIYAWLPNNHEPETVRDALSRAILAYLSAAKPTPTPPLDERARQSARDAVDSMTDHSRWAIADAAIEAYLSATHPPEIEPGAVCEECKERLNLWEAALKRAIAAEKVLREISETKVIFPMNIRGTVPIETVEGVIAAIAQQARAALNAIEPKPGDKPLPAFMRYRP